MAQVLPTANAAWTLLYNVIGYEPCAPKYALLRPCAPGTDLPTEAIWTLRRGNAEVLRGVWQPLCEVEGVAYWRADMSQCQEPGRYQLVCALDANRPEGSLATTPFRIAQDILLQSTLRPIALDGARLRAAPAHLGGGYLDANRPVGRVDAHATFAVSLMHVLTRRGRALSALERAELIWSIDHAIDYILALCDRDHGYIAPQSRRRWGHAGTVVNATAHGLWALATYADVFRGDSPLRARQAGHQALAAAAWLEKEHPASFPSSLQVTVNGSLWWHLGEPEFLQRALNGLRDQVEAWEKGHGPASQTRMVPCFEGLYWLRKRLARDPELDQLLARLAHSLSEEYLAAELGVFPWSAATAGTWPDPCDNEALLQSALDVLYLSELLNAPDLAELATMNLAWISGLNKGVPGAAVTNPHSDASVESAPFIYGARGRHVKACKAWEWNVGRNWLIGLVRRAMPGNCRSAQPPTGFMSLLTGYGYHGTDETNQQGGSVSLKLDGLWLYASCLHADHYAVDHK